MKKIFLVLACITFSGKLFAETPDISTFFKDKSACFILYDLKQDKTVISYNPKRCAQRIPANSTFKIPLSLMAFDQKLINQNTIFKWDGKKRKLGVWNQNQTPVSWLQNSVVWVSQLLTTQMGLNTVKDYLAKFNYGNQDFSGDPGQNNGLTEAWLSSSLKISGDEQLRFIKALVTDRLPVSQQAIDNTRANMYLETSAKGWKLYGKTGSGYHHPEDKWHHLSMASVPQDGSFTGFIEKPEQTYLLVVNFTDLQKPESSQLGGSRAKGAAKAILTELGLF